MGEWADKIMAGIRERLVDELDAIGVDMVDGIRESISTPVVRNEAGEVIQRSPPGGYPWMDTRHLWESERHEVLPGGPGLDVINDASYARRLNYGDSNLKARPFHDLAKAEWIPQIRARSAAAIVGKAG